MESKIFFHSNNLGFNVIMGAPGSGKTTFAREKCKNRSNGIDISCGDLYRNYHKLPKYEFLQKAKEESKDAWIQALQEFIILALIEEIQKNINENSKLDSKIDFFIDGLWIDNLSSFQERIGKIQKIYYIKCDIKTSKERLYKRGRPQDFRNLESRINNYYEREKEIFDTLSGLSSKVNIKYL